VLIREIYKKIFFPIFFIFGSIVWSQNLHNDIIINGNIGLLDRKITIYQLQNFSKNDLRILRNTIYAKYGYKFISTDLNNHFSQFDWYSGVLINVDHLLTEVDKENINLVQSVEKNYPEENNLNNDIIGRWYYFGAVAAEGISNIESMRKSDYVIFLENGIYIYFHTGKSTWPQFRGLWNLKENIFETIPIGVHEEYYVPTYGRVENFILNKFVLNDGSNHLASNLFGGGSWVKE